MTDINYTPDAIYRIIVTRIRHLEQEAHQIESKINQLTDEIGRLTTMALAYSENYEGENQ